MTLRSRLQLRRVVHRKSLKYRAGLPVRRLRELSAKYRGWSRQVAFDSPFISSLLEDIENTYDREAEWHDTDANLRRRLPDGPVGQDLARGPSKRLRTECNGKGKATKGCCCCGLKERGGDL
jgi:hypothetical protein